MENDILSSLEVLGYNGPLMEEGALEKCVQNEGITVEFMEICKWLTDEIQVLTGIIEKITGTDKDEFTIEISGFLREYGCPHSELLGVTGLNSTENRLLLLGFLTSELQACRILGQDDEAMEVDQEEASPAFEHLSAILSALDLPQPTKETSVFELLSDIERKVNEVLRKCPRGYLGEPLLTKHLSAKQWAQVEKINKTLSREYSLRRQTLLTRLDVTVRSFEWSETGKKKQDSISSDYQPIRTSLAVQAPVSVADVLAARTDLTKVTKTSSGALREKTKCAINRVLIGKVPFRGGKPSAKGPSPDMPQFAKRQEPPPQRGGKGGRGGRGRLQGASGGGRGSTDHGGAEFKRDGQKKGWSGDRGGRRRSQDGNPFGDKGGYQHDTFRS